MKKWLMLEGYIDKLDLLLENKLTVLDTEILVPRNIRGISFPEDNLKNVILTLGIDPKKKFTQVKTNRTNLYLLGEKEYQVTAKTSNLEAWKYFLPVLQNFASVIKKNIDVYNPHGSTKAKSRAKTKLSIYFFSTPVNTERTKIIEAFNIALINGGAQSAVTPSGRGFPIKDNTGTTIAEIVDENNLYILFDLPHDSRSESAKILEIILKKYLDFINLKGEDAKKWKKKQALQKIKEDEDRYIKACIRRKSNMLENQKRKLEQTELELSKVSERFVDLLRTQEEISESISLFETKNKEAQEVFLKEFRNLKSIKDVETVDVNDTHLIIKTKMIEIVVGTRVYKIGKFEISIPFSGKINQLKFHNCTKIYDGYHHPHINSWGTACLGNISHGVAKYIAQYEFAAVAQVLINYLQNFNSSDCYRHATCWPEKAA